jgi:transposase
MLYAKVDQTARDRLKVIDLSAKGQKVSELAAIFDLSENTVRGYINRYNQGGLAGLKADYGQGRNKTITLSKDELVELLRRSPSQFEKLETGARNWNQALLKQYLCHYHQIEVSQSAISGLFKRLGIPWNRAKKK